MNDILVRLPTSQVDHFYGDKMTAPMAYWRFHSKPVKLEVGDYIFFTRPEGVIAGAKITAILNGDDDEFSGYLDFPGNWNACWEGTGTIEISPAVKNIQYAGRGFRYALPKESALLRRRLNK